MSSVIIHFQYGHEISNPLHTNQLQQCLKDLIMDHFPAVNDANKEINENRNV